MNNSYFIDVCNFHKKFGFKKVNKPSLLKKDLYNFRYKFLLEELQEFKIAHENNDLIEMSDALVDLVYVVLGTAYHMGLPFDDLWKEVHTANMLKKRCINKLDSKRKSKFDIIKPKGWKHPNLKKILNIK